MCFVGECETKQNTAAGRKYRLLIKKEWVYAANCGNHYD
jgi:hypothetical protein